MHAGSRQLRPELLTGSTLARVTAPPPDLDALDLGGTVVGPVLHTTDKSWLAEGSHGGRPVVVKILTSTDPAWRARFAHEIGVYRALADRPAPARTPGLVHTDGTRLLVVERLPGRPLGADRYPAAAADLEPVLQALDAFAGWAPPARALGPSFDHAGRIDRYHRLGIVDDDSRAALHHLLTGLPEPGTPAHGDPLPSNLIVDDAPRCGLVDFEFTGRFLPGFDLALLHTLLVRVPGAQARIRSHVTDADAFLAARAVVLARELRMHRALDDGARRRDRLRLIEPQWRDVVRELRSVSPSRPRPRRGRATRPAPGC